MSKLTPKNKTDLRRRRHVRIRARVVGSAERPRLAVFRSNRYIYAQIIDDEKGITLAAATTRGAKSKKGMTMMEQAVSVGVKIAKAAHAQGVERVIFDRGGFAYAGTIATLAEAARKEGLQF